MGIPTRLLKDADGNEVIGKVTVSPASNTLLARLKDLLTGIALAAGTNIIGKVRLATEPYQLYKSQDRKSNV